jgi:ATP-dependent Clp protease protease subunit
VTKETSPRKSKAATAAFNDNNQPAATQAAAKPAAQGASPLPGGLGREFQASVIPSVGDGNRSWDIYSSLMNNARIIWLTSEVRDENCELLKAELMKLDSENHNPITIWIDSPGGGVDSGMSVYDMMQRCQSPIATVVAGKAMSMGSVISAGGTPGMRYALPNGHIMVHGPSSQSTGGKEPDQKIGYVGIKECLEKMGDLYVTWMGLDENDAEDNKLVRKLLDKDTFMNPYMALKCGLIDGILTPVVMNPAKEKVLATEMRTNIRQFERLVATDDSGTDDQRYVIKEIAAKREKYTAEVEAGKRSNPMIVPVATGKELSVYKP